MKFTQVFRTRVSVAILSTALLSSCGFNLLYYVASGKDSKEVQLEDARILLDKKDYAGAATILTKLKDSSDKDSNDVRLMLAAANLGVSGLDIWSIVATLLEKSTEKSGSANSILSSISDDLIRTGDEKVARLAALEEAIDALKSAPDPEETRVQDTACFLGAILVVPTIAEATTALAALQTAITAAAGGNCDGAAGLSTALGDLTATASRFSLVLDTAKACPFLKIDTSSVDGVNGALNSLITGADKGCDAFPAGMEALIPACVQKAAGLPNDRALAGDKRIDSCELVLHCYDPVSCFKS
jgi:hypothetical protein